MRQENSLKRCKKYRKNCLKRCKSYIFAAVMRRKVYDKLLKWKAEDQGRVAILLDGARRVGKSYIAREFAKEYKSAIFVDFSDMSQPLRHIFDNYLHDRDELFLQLQLHFHVTLHERNSLIVFDEVQEYPQARAAIKHLVADGRYDYIETGSLVSINKNVKDILIPSEERRIKMYPMDFEEFLWALGDEMMMPFVKNCFEKKRPLGPVHAKAMDYFRKYLLIGGMPQVVKNFVEHRDFRKVDREKRMILDLYRQDIEKHADRLEKKVKSIFDTIPAELQRHEKKFRLADLEKNAKFRSYESSFVWLDEARVVNLCFAATEPNVGLGLKLDNMRVKCYFADTGLLVSHAFDENELMDNNLYQKLLLDKLEINKGMLVENIVAQMLAAAGHKLYFYSNASRDDAEERMEIDFLVRKLQITSRHNISPIEVKSGAGYSLSSLTKCINKFSPYLSTPYVLHSADYKEEGNITYLPLYMTPLL